MSYPSDAPAAAWYPDPQMAGRVRWWDGTSWTEHVSVPANPMQADQVAIEAAVPQIAEADAALAAADAEHAAADQGARPGFIGRHAAGENPAPRQAPRVPPIRPRERTAAVGEQLLSA